MAFGLTAYVSRCWLPAIAQGSLPAAGQAFPGRHSPAGLRQKVFNSLHVRWPPFPSFLAQSPESQTTQTTQYMRLSRLAPLLPGSHASLMPCPLAFRGPCAGARSGARRRNSAQSSGSSRFCRCQPACVVYADGVPERRTTKRPAEGQRRRR